MTMTGNEIREKFLQFFESKGHRRVRSSSLVPHGDATLLFTNAGMNQFKDVFLGVEKRDYARATTAQKCVRAGGKHNDLENVGFTKRHHTFFEMLGNFSFGDYFKKEAIAYAWELITSPEWFAIDKEKLYVTVFGGAEVAPGTSLGVDEEAHNFWLQQNVAADRVVPIPGLKDNFWAMGDTGPCGPCSEIFYDMGPAASEPGHADCKFPCDCGRYVEIWNLVFMQFNRDSSGTLTPLPKPCVDTGMGLERVAAVLQGVISNYDTDLFAPLTTRAAELSHKKAIRDSDMQVVESNKAVLVTAAGNVQPSLRVIADHSRAATFLISDGVIPANEGRGYVLRKIIRRALMHVRFLAGETPFLSRMAEAVRQQMLRAYPELSEHAALVDRVLDEEERRFTKTLDLGIKKTNQELADYIRPIFEANIGNLDVRPAVVNRSLGEWDDQRILKQLSSGNNDEVAQAVGQAITRLKEVELVFPGERVFQLYDTFGLRKDLIEDLLRDLGVEIDAQGFDRAMEEQRTRARSSWKHGGKKAASPVYARIAETFRTEPSFYYGTDAKDCRIEAILTDQGPVGELKPGDCGEIVLDRTAIYAESGGQVADVGWLYDNSESQVLADVVEAHYPVSGLIAHKVMARETLQVGDRVTVVADADRRARIMRNHTGTHLVHAALRNILGPHVKQAGSLNSADHLRFDFSHFAAVDSEELRDIEQQVNDEIRLNTELQTNVTSLDDALASGALAFFGDKYPEHNVRVVTIPDPRAPRGFYSKELCGGTHVHRAGDVGVVKIVKEESVAAGVRRIEAVTGIGALEHYQHQANVLASLAKQLNVGEDAVLATVEKLTSTTKQLEKQLADQRRKGALNQLDELAAKAHTIKGVKVIVSQVEGLDRDGIRQLVDSLRQKLGSGVVVLGQAEGQGTEGKVTLIAGVTKDLTAKVHAGKVIQTLAKQVGGKGGGRPDLAEGGGVDTKGLNSTLGGVPALLEPLL